LSGNFIGFLSDPMVFTRVPFFGHGPGSHSFVEKANMAWKAAQSFLCDVVLLTCQGFIFEQIKRISIVIPAFEDLCCVLKQKNSRAGSGLLSEPIFEKLHDSLWPNGADDCGLVLFFKLPSRQNAHKHGRVRGSALD
jgi:hypothetical protein